MTEEEKDILITRMLDRPGSLSDSEIEKILADDELRDIYSISCGIKGAKRCQTEIDASAEWQRFAPRLSKPRRWAFARITRIAAAFAGLLIAAGIFLNLINKPEPDKTSLLAEQMQMQPEATAALSILAAPIKDMQRNESVTHQKKKKKPKRAKTEVSQAENQETAEDIDIDEYLRIEQARIDNDLAMQRAEMILCQYYSMAEMMGEEPLPIKALINYGDANTADDNISTLLMP